MSRIRVGLYCPPFFDGYGGAQKYSVAIAEYILRTYRDVELRVVAENIPSVDPLGVVRARYGADLDGEVRFVDPGGPSGGSPVSKAIRHELLRRTSDDCDLFVNCFHNLHFFRGTKNVHLVHFPAARREAASPTLARNAPLRRVARFLDRRYWSSYDLFLCNSRFSMGWLRRYWGDDPGRQQVLYPPVDRVVAIDYAVRKQSMILMCSRFDRRKNLLEGAEFFRRNMHRFPGYTMVVAGSVSSADEREYAGEIEAVAVGSGGRLRLIRSPDREELSRLYAASRFFWHFMGFTVDQEKNPLDVEHFGISTVEAMSAGTVPLAIDKGGQREIVDDGRDGYLWSDLDTLASTTERLINDPNLTQALSLAARRKSESFSAEAFESAIDRVCVGGGLMPMEHHR